MNGYNYRLTVSADSESSATYLIQVYQSLSGQLEVNSVTLQNVAAQPNFQKSLTAEEAAKIPYFSALRSALEKKESTTLVSGSVLNKVSKDYPYFELVYSNNQGRFTYLIKYDAFTGELTVVNASAVGIPVSVEEP